MRAKLILTCATLLASVFLSADTASACSCAGDGSPCEAYGAASAVFVGTVTGVTTAPRGEAGKAEWSSRVFKFSVGRAFSGVEGAEVEIGTGTGGGDCGYGFRQGASYLVYAYAERRGGRLSTGICTRTRPVADAGEDLEFLTGLAGRAEGVTVSGAVVRTRQSVKKGDSEQVGPLPGAAVSIEADDGRKVEARTDARGRYQLAGLKPGRYKLKLLLPEELFEPRPEREVTIADRGCSTVDYYVTDNGRVSGEVTDAEGNPAAGILVALVEAEGYDIERDYSLLERTDAEGRYSFTAVPPGGYLLAVNLTRYPQPNDPSNAYPTTYYPGVAQAGDAEVVSLAAGGSVRGRNIRLPPRRAESVAEVIVVWADGTPVANAQVSFRDVTRHDSRLSNGGRADARGRFALKGYEGQTLVVEARSSRTYIGDFKRDGPMERAEPVRITLAARNEPAKITITRLR